MVEVVICTTMKPRWRGYLFGIQLQNCFYICSVREVVFSILKMSAFRQHSMYNKMAQAHSRSIKSMPFSQCHIFGPKICLFVFSSVNRRYQYYSLLEIQTIVIKLVESCSGTAHVPARALWFHSEGARVSLPLKIDVVRDVLVTNIRISANGNIVPIQEIKSLYMASITDSILGI